MLDVIVNDIKTSLPGVPMEVVEELKSEVIRNNEIEALVIPIYSRHFTEEEIDQLILFFKSPLGRLYISRTNEVVKESMEVGKRWGEELYVRFLKKLKQKGYN